MPRNASHRNQIVTILVTARQVIPRPLKQRLRPHKTSPEVTHSEKQNRIWILNLDFRILVNVSVPWP